jgi:CheY-like chemotaxis protein
METILIADDDSDSRLILWEQLRQDGYAMIEAEDGAQARHLVEKHHESINAIILDWKMPKVDGIEVVQWLRERPEFELIPVIMHTGLSDSKQIQEGIDAGATYYLLKDGSHELLRSIVRTAVSDYNYKKALLQKVHEGENPYKLLVAGTFRFRTMKEGEYLALRIANASEQPEKAVTISELFANAVEHGNLDISYDEKTRLLNDGTYQETISRRLSSPEFSKRYVEVHLQRRDNVIEVLIADQGNGFSYTKYLTFDPTRAFDNHGRGIAIARSQLLLEYLGVGNRVRVTIPVPGQNNVQHP